MRIGLASKKKPGAVVAVLGPAMAGLLLAGCDTPRLTSPTAGIDPDAVPQWTVPAPATALSVWANGVTARAGGGGHFHLTLSSGLDTDVQFAFTAVQRDASGDANGNFHFASSPEGMALNIHGYITCMTTDPANPGRAWMGGVITKNESQHPAFVGETKEVGDDAWFRVVDYGEGGNALQPDRTTSIFFEPTGNFHSGREFCDGQLWFANDRVTNPLLNGNIQVKH